MPNIFFVKFYAVKKFNIKFNGIKTSVFISKNPNYNVKVILSAV